MPWALIASPGDKRTLGFCAALERLGEGPAIVISWPQLAEDPAAALAGLPEGTCLRIESPGRDRAGVDCLTRCGGGQPAAEAVWQPGAARFRGAQRLLREVARLLPQRDLRVMNDPDDILTMCDKDACRRHLAAAGIAIAPGLPICRTSGELNAAMAAPGWTRVFVKPRWGSSGAGVIAYQRRVQQGQPAQGIAITTLRQSADGQLQLSKQLMRYDDQALIAALIDRVLSDGAVVERWVPKHVTSRGPMDLRVVAMGGEPRHRVARIGSGPITNLHLDAERSDIATACAGVPAARVAAIDPLVAQVAAAFPNSWQLGCDILPTQGLRRLVVGEVNAWGDYLPGLLHAGEDTWTAEIRTFVAARAMRAESA